MKLSPHALPQVLHRRDVDFSGSWDAIKDGEAIDGRRASSTEPVMTLKSRGAALEVPHAAWHACFGPATAQTAKTARFAKCYITQTDSCAVSGEVDGVESGSVKMVDGAFVVTFDDGAVADAVNTNNMQFRGKDVLCTPQLCCIYFPFKSLNLYN